LFGSLDILTVSDLTHLVILKTDFGKVYFDKTVFINYIDDSLTDATLSSYCVGLLKLSSG